MGGSEATLDLEYLRRGVDEANIPALLMVLVQMTGDLRWIRDPYTPTRTRGLSDHATGGLSPEVQADVRDAALDAIVAWRQGRPLAIPVPADDLLVEMMTVCMGQAVPEEYGPMLASELSIAEVPLLGPSSREHEEGQSHPQRERPHVLVIGAGASGIIAAVMLRRAGIPFTILERNKGLGGVWFENRYPGCGVDTPSHYYSFSFAPYDWHHYFATRDELHAYLREVIETFGIEQHIRFDTAAVSARYDVGRQGWDVDTRTSDGTTETFHADVVISAVGAFGQPKMPAIEGLDQFEGQLLHTAQWPATVDLDGKRVGVVGTGASAMQLVPSIAGTVSELTIFQRSAQWAAPFEQFQTPIPEAVRYLLMQVPLYRAWYRVRLNWVFTDSIHASLQKDPDWEHPDRAVNAINDGHRAFFTRHIQNELGDRVDLLAATVPDYPPFGKRILLDNGWFRTLTRDNVRLVTESIKEIGPHSVTTESGTAHELDVLILATGFDVVHFLASIDVRGRSGRTLAETWDGDDARAYLGCAIPDLPNFFCLYGPNTQTAGGSLMFMLESQMYYIAGVLEQMIDNQVGAVELREQVHREYNERVDAAHERMIWTHPGFDTYYRNSRGRVVVANPFRMVDYWQMCRQPTLDDYQTEPR
jgi:4-hydroxyacetophenone monooxygenase